MVARILLAAAAGVITSVLTVSASASAASIPPGRYRVYWEPRPNSVVLPHADGVSRPVGGRDDTVDVHQWEFVAIDYRAGEPVFQMRNMASRLCLNPSQPRSGIVGVEQNTCGVGDSETWNVTETGRNYRITLASDPRTALYADRFGASEPAAALAQIGDQPAARWILEPIARRR
ncbi:RICIN domain-containing protein [Nocardia thraciensis]